MDPRLGGPLLRRSLVARPALCALGALTLFSVGSPAGEPRSDRTTRDATTRDATTGGATKRDPRSDDGTTGDETTGDRDIATPADAIRRYLEMPLPSEDPLGEARIARLDALGKLKGMRDVPAAIEAALPEVEDPLRRRELVEALRAFPSREAAGLLERMLHDADEGVRGEAIHALRLFARRVDRVGPERRRRREDLAPAVEGLVPLLVRAAADPSETNRVKALYALADARDPEALEELRRRIDDPSERVRFHAACFLTEFHDARGLPEMRRHLERLRTGDRRDVLRFWDAGHLLSSLERITGKGFGPIPMNPGLHSHSERAREAEEEFERLIEAWAAWWAWEPPVEPSTEPSAEPSAEPSGDPPV